MTATIKAKAVNEGRRAPRKPTRSLGYIVSDRLSAPIECTIVDLSASGAKLKLTSITRKAFSVSVVLPEDFRIELPRDKQMIDCKLAWQTDDAVGVSFLSPFKPLKPIGRF